MNTQGWSILLDICALMVNVAGWYFTYRGQRALAHQQRAYEREKEVRQNLTPVRIRQLDVIESWLNQALPMVGSLRLAPEDKEARAYIHAWHYQVAAMVELAKLHDPEYLAVVADDQELQWLQSSVLPFDLPRLLSAIALTVVEYVRVLRARDRAPRKHTLERLVLVHSHAQAALERVRRHVAANDA
jgi:hypothetical protein